MELAAYVLAGSDLYFMVLSAKELKKNTRSVLDGIIVGLYFDPNSGHYTYGEKLSLEDGCPRFRISSRRERYSLVIPSMEIV